jgi:hypothetical protein
VVKRHPLVAFFVLAYALSWWYAMGVFGAPVAGFGPFLAALLVLALTEGRAGVVGLLRATTPTGPSAPSLATARRED